ncbi:hypothetical protein COZ78_03435 [bacterium (Candidatus Gribaldobacteria) CG_4_8_14_3_um_filter_42_11]|uniref:Uncharacterized protein n=1 Tax=bacterium (Candidatus Gribaldobacteria) CG_4_8_14_3_um_filter_42_11 TaxID=2014267 RepID=A0A2M7IXI0_9BACT|nr:MAG: hypothetical protein COZ78_03435 [bacterium (Candidatus Gribaldobacteria) CG_4_8_14_3_um_filter_42_11]
MKMKWLIGIFCFLFVLGVVIFRPEQSVAAIALVVCGPGVFVVFEIFFRKRQEPRASRLLLALFF